MFSTPLLRHDFRGGKFEPFYIDERYAPLARSLAIHYEAFAGKPYGELNQALAETSDAACGERKVVLGLREVIEESMDLEVRAPVDPRKIRSAVFDLAARKNDVDRVDVFRRAAEELSAPASELAGCLYADLKPERFVTFRRPIAPVHEIIARYNFRLLQGFFCHAEKVRVEADSHLRAIYRFAKLHGLIVEAQSSPEHGGRLSLEITGPLSLFQRTRKYALSLAQFLPACTTAQTFKVEARIVLNEKQGTLCVTHADRVLSSHRPPRAFDSKLEERFQRDFIGLGSRWDISREENLIPLGSTVFIPDFTFRMRGRPELRVDLEIVGYWTRDYLARKQLIISRLPPSRIIFCVDERLRCGGDAVPFPFLSFHGRVPAQKVLSILEDFARREAPPGSAPHPEGAPAPQGASDAGGGPGPPDGRALGTH